MANTIEVRNLTKYFGQKIVFNDINFYISENKIVALTGKNGSGKTTLLKLISGLLLPDKGNIFVLDNDIKKYREETKQILGISINSEKGFYPNLSLLENLKIFCNFYKVKLSEISSYITLLGLENFLDTKFSHCSSGIKHRFSLLFSVINNPKVVLIDELTKSIDYESKEKIYNFILHLKSKKVTTVFVTHTPEEIKLLSDLHLHIENQNIIKK